MLEASKINFGKMFIVGFEGTTLTDSLTTKLKQLDPGGIIFFDTNIESRQQVKQLIRDLKKLLGEDLIISVDQEGGKVQRLRKISPNLPSLMAVGKVSAENEDADLLVEHTKLLAYDLKDLGFNFVFAPCVDLNTNSRNPVIGTRSLGHDCKLVMEQAAIMVETFVEARIGCCVKHFPGHGATDIDSHLALPHISLDHHNYMGHLSPFFRAIEEGVDAIMTAHILVDVEDIETQSAICSTHPVSLSREFIMDDLRDNFGFSGLVISDEITMKALAEYGDYKELALDMIFAGNNLIIWNTNIDDAVAVADYLNNLKSSNVYEFYARYHETISKLYGFFNDLRRLGSEPEAFDQAAAMTRMHELCLAAIELNKPLPQIQSYFETKDQELAQKDTAVVILQHPKLEEDEIREVFALDTYLIKTVDDFDKVFFSRYKTLILMSFQSHFCEQGQSLIKKFKNIDNTNLLYVACDQPDPEADVNLLGAAKIHYQALKDLIFTNKKS